MDYAYREILKDIIEILMNETGKLSKEDQDEEVQEYIDRSELFLKDLYTLYKKHNISISHR